MSTHSYFVVECNDNSFRSVYCHWDGYLSHNGRLLLAHYTTQEQAESLVALGDMSSLGETLQDCNPYNDSDSAMGINSCLAGALLICRREIVYYWNKSEQAWFYSKSNTTPRNWTRLSDCF
jgi:hypothetical protein